MSDQVEVVALQAGHDGRMYRAAGERFKVPAERLKDGSSWFVLPEDVPPPKPASKPARPPGAGPARGSATGVDPAVGAGPEPTG